MLSQTERLCAGAGVATWNGTQTVDEWEFIALKVVYTSLACLNCSCCCRRKCLHLSNRAKDPSGRLVPWSAFQKEVKASSKRNQPQLKSKIRAFLRLQSVASSGPNSRRTSVWERPLLFWSIHDNNSVAAIVLESGEPTGAPMRLNVCTVVN